MIVTHRQLVSRAWLASIRLRMRHHARTVLQDWQTWTVMPRLHAVHVCLARMLQELGQAVMRVWQDLLIWTPTHPVCVKRVVWVSSRLLGLWFAQRVSRVELMRTPTHRRRVLAVRVVGMRVLDLQTALCVRQVRLTWTAMLQPNALLALLGTTLAQVRQLAHLVQLVSTMRMEMQALCVCFALLGISLL